MKNKLIATSSITINAPVAKVWNTIINPASLEKIMLGMRPISHWKAGSELHWKGRHKEKEGDEAKGKILSMVKDKELKFTFFYAGYGYPDEQKYYNTVAFHLTPKGNETVVETEQGDFSVFKEGETFIVHTRTFWNDALKVLKQLCESKKIQS